MGKAREIVTRLEDSRVHERREGIVVVIVKGGDRCFDLSRLL